jgi:hypothetical protein
VANTPTTPRTWVAAETHTAAHHNQIRDNEDYLLTSKPNCRVFNSAAISITNNTLTALTFDSERYDKGSGSHSTSSNTGRLTVPTSCGGVYHIFGSVEFASNAAGYRWLYLRVNGTTTIAGLAVPPVSGAATPMVISTSYSLAAADYVELLVLQTSGGALNAAATANYSPEFGWVWQST